MAGISDKVLASLVHAFTHDAGVELLTNFIVRFRLVVIVAQAHLRVSGLLLLRLTKGGGGAGSSILVHVAHHGLSRWLGGLAPVLA